MTDSSASAVLLHGGTSARRSALATHLRESASVRVRVSSRAAEAAKCLADPAVVAVFLIDGPHDGDTVRQNAAQRGLAKCVYDLQPRDEAEVVIALVRNVLSSP